MYCNFNRAPNKLTNMLQGTAAWRDAFKVASRSASMRFWLLVAGETESLCMSHAWRDSG